MHRTSLLSLLLRGVTVGDVKWLSIHVIAHERIGADEVVRMVYEILVGVLRAIVHLAMRWRVGV